MDWAERNEIFWHFGPRPIKVKFLLITFIKRINFKSRQVSLWRTGSSIYNLSLRAPVRMCPNHDPIGRCQEPQPMGGSNTRGPQYLDFFINLSTQIGWEYKTSSLFWLVTARGWSSWCLSRGSQPREDENGYADYQVIHFNELIILLIVATVRKLT